MGDFASITSAKISTFLLEKTRVVEEMKFLQSLKLEGPENYHYLNQQNCYVIDGKDECVAMVDTLSTLLSLGFSKLDIQYILQVLASILLLGNVSFFKKNDAEEMKSTPKSKLQNRMSLSSKSRHNSQSPRRRSKSLCNSPKQSPTNRIYQQRNSYTSPGIRKSS